MQKINRDMLDLTGYVNVWREQTYTASAGQIDFVLTSGTYPVNRNMMSVYLNGDLQRKNLDYTEFDSTKVRFIGGLREGDIVHLRWQVPFSEVLLSWPDIKIEEAKKVANVMKGTSLVATEGQTVVTLTTPYEPGTNSVNVYVNGGKQRTGIDFTEPQKEHIIFTEGLRAGDRVEVTWLAPSSNILLGTVSIEDAPDGSVPRAKIAGLTSDLEQREINVKQAPFNVKGDGVTDDTAAITSVFAYMKANNLTRVYFPSGTYIVDFVFKLDFDISIRGAGRDTTKIKVKDQSTLFHNPTRHNTDATKVGLSNLYRNYHAVFFIHDANFTMTGIDIDGNPANQTDVVGGVTWNYVAPTIGNGSRNYYKYIHGIVTLYTTKVNPFFRLENCRVYGFSWNNIAFGNNITSSFYKVDAIIRNNELEAGAQDIVTIHRVSGVRVFNNKIINPNSHGTHVYYDASDVHISDNEFILNDTYFNFVPNTSTLSKNLIQIGHADYINNMINSIYVERNTMKNDSVDKPCVGVITSRTLEDLHINDNKMYNVTTGLSSSHPVRGNNEFKRNTIYYKSIGAAFRPFLPDGTFNDIKPEVARPYASFWDVSDNHIKHVTNDVTKMSIDLKLFGGTVSSSILSEMRLRVKNNEVTAQAFDTNSIFTLVKEATLDVNTVALFSSSITTFEKERITYTSVGSGHANLASFPSGKEGTLVTYRTNDDAYAFQEYHVKLDNKTYKRYWTGSAWSAFAPSNSLSLISGTFATPITSYPDRSESFYIVSSGTPDLASYPEGKRGVVRTFRFNFDDYSYQEYHVWHENAVYRRWWSTTTNLWSAFQKITVV